MRSAGSGLVSWLQKLHAGKVAAAGLGGEQTAGRKAQAVRAGLNNSSRQDGGSTYNSCKLSALMSGSSRPKLSCRGGGLAL